MVGVHFLWTEGVVRTVVLIASTRSTDHSIMHANRLKYGHSHRLLGGCVLQSRLW